MRLKEIKEDMYIHCKDENEKKILWDELCRIGNMTEEYVDEFENFKDASLGKYKINNLKEEVWEMSSKDDCIELSDLIIQEEPLSAIEVIEILWNGYGNGKYIEIFEKDYLLGSLLEKFTPSEIVQKVTEWKHKQMEELNKVVISKCEIDELLDEKYGKEKWKIEE